MSNADPNEIESKLIDCAKEPIHVPYSIQPHGYLIALNKESGKITRLSGNISTLFIVSVDELLGEPGNTLFESQFIRNLTASAGNCAANASSAIELIVREQMFDAVAHFAGNELVIELEPKSEESKASEKHVLYDLENFCAKMLDCKDFQSLYESLAKYTRKVTGFERVKIYQFDEDWNGRVIAEDKVEHVDSYIGLNFPASDIPSQARELYKRNLLRQIVDSRYTAVPVVSHESVKESAFDMSYSVLRSVSPIHLQYLQNMGIGASMSISILKDEELWGLVVCHHSKANFVSYKIRTLCEIMSHVFSSRHLALHKEIAHREEQELHAVADSLLSSSAGEQHDKLLVGAEESSMSLLRADGLALFNGSDIQTLGNVPDSTDLQHIYSWYSQRQNRKVVATVDICSTLIKQNIHIDYRGGALIAPIGFKLDNFVCWFRDPQITKVNWAGNPDKNAEIDKKGRLTPRHSFAVWKSEVKHKSEPWEPSCLGAAEYIVAVIQELEKRKTEAKNLAKTDFLSHMSHELRTPLSAISSIAQILGDESGFSSDTRKLIDSLKVSSRSLMSLVNDLLDLNRIEAGAVELDNGAFSCEELIEEVRSVMAIDANRKGLSFNINYGSGKELVLEGDMGKLRQVLFNLVGNAIKFTLRGFINVFCVVSVQPNNPEKAIVTIDVSDTGMGIDDDKIDVIFDKFTQADNSISNQYGGSGLGLTISKSLIEIMGGKMSVTSKKGMGTKFTIAVNLPILQQQKKLSKKNSKGQESESPLNNVHILLAEDYQGNLVAILHYLQSKGFHVSIANNGEEAVEIALTQTFNVILMDVQMPILDGVSATRLIREGLQERGLQPIPIIGMTASAMREDRDRCLDAGMSDYITKPLKLEELFDKIKRHL